MSRRLVRFAIVVTAVAVGWGVALPALLRCGPVARHVRRMEERRVTLWP